MEDVIEPINGTEEARVVRRVLRRALIAGLAFWLLGIAFFLLANMGTFGGPTQPGTLSLIVFTLGVPLLWVQQWRWSRLVAAVIDTSEPSTPVTITFRRSATNLAIVETGQGAGAQQLIVPMMRVARDGRSLGWRKTISHYGPRPALLYADFAKRVAIGISDDELFVPKRRWVYRPRR